jgi:hypothetical protein
MPFPKTLTEVDVARHVRQTLGFTGGAIAVGAALGLAGALAAGAREWKVFAGLGVAIVGGGLYEWSQRRKPITLVADEQSGEVGVYQGLALVKVLTTTGFTEFRLSIINTIREFMALVVFTSMTSLGVVGYLKEPGPILFMMLGACIASWGALISSFLVRLRSKHWLLQTDAVNAAVPFPKARLAAEMRGILPV